VDNRLDWDEEDTPIGVPGPPQIEINIFNRVIHNEIGLIDRIDIEEQAIALIYALINLSEYLGISVAKLLTGVDVPGEEDYCTKHVMFNDGRLSLLSTLEPSLYNYESLIIEILSGTIRDPLYGAYRFFNYIEDEHPESHRSKWGISEEDDVKTGIIYGKFEYDPILFLKARAMGQAEYNHLEHWETQRRAQ